MLKSKPRILAFTGAGISKDSGIDTFLEHPEIRDCLFREVANHDPQRYKRAIEFLKAQVKDAQPNDAHKALYEYGIDIITMNIDGLHEKAGSKPLTLHGTLPSDEEMPICHQLYNKPVLYGDLAPNYKKAFEWVEQLKPEDIFLVIGASGHTAISNQLQLIAQYQGARIIQIQSDAKTRVRQLLKEELSV